MFIYTDKNNIINPIKNPEKISPKGILDIGIGPKEYNIPVIKDITPMNKVIQPVR
jgi:hypothetical protein